MSDNPEALIEIRSPRRAKNVRCSEPVSVVPADSGDRVTLYGPEESPEAPTRWEVEGDKNPEVRQGTSLTLRLTPWLVGPRRWLGQVVPKTVAVLMQSAKGELQRVELRVFPADRLSVTFDATQFGQFSEAFSEVHHALGCFIEGWHARLLEGTCKLEAGWEECEDHRAFYRWELSLGFDPLLGVSGRYSLGPLALIPSFVRRHCLDAGVFVDAIGKISVIGSVGRFTPGMLAGGVSALGTIEFGMGISAHVLQRVAMVELRGRTSLIASASVIDQGSAAPMLGVQVAWDGIRGDATIKLVGGLIFTMQVTVAAPEVLIHRELQLPLERLLESGLASGQKVPE